MRNYSKENWDRVIKLTAEFEADFGLSPYRKAIMGMAMLNKGEVEAAERIFQELARSRSTEPNEKYVSLFSAARLYAMEGQHDLKEKCEAEANSIQCSMFVKINLPTS